MHLGRLSLGPFIFDCLLHVASIEPFTPPCRRLSVYCFFSSPNQRNAWGHQSSRCFLRTLLAHLISPWPRPFYSCIWSRTASTILGYFLAPCEWRQRGWTVPDLFYFHTSFELYPFLRAYIFLYFSRATRLRMILTESVGGIWCARQTRGEGATREWDMFGVGGRSARWS